MTIQITAENFTAAMREAVAERGEDYVYSDGQPGWEAKDGGCRYALDDGTPACLIGLALYKVDPSLVPTDDGLNAYQVLYSLGASKDVLLAAGNAQEMQDTGKTWGQALVMYESLMGVRT